MLIFPAIDVLDGQVVRLEKGDFDAVTAYGDDPVSVARRFREAGAEWLHLVDLSGARDGARRETPLLAEIAEIGLKVQTGGGVRSNEDIRAILDAGAERAVIGSLAITQPQTVIGWLSAIGPERIVAAFDVRIEADGVAWPAVKGWTERAPKPLADLLADYAEGGLRHAMATDIARDGVLQGPNPQLYRELTAARPDIAWQASGGVASVDDLAPLAEVGCAAVIIGKALYEGRVELGDLF